MNEATERKNRIISGISTAIICVLLFLLFWFYNFKFEIPEPPMGSEVEVSLGEPDAGGPEEVPVSAESKPSVPTMPEPEQVQQTNDPDAVATKKTSDQKKKQDQPAEKESEDDLLKSLQKGKQTQKPVNAGGGTQTGQQGQPDGSTTGSTTGTQGTGTGGTGTRHSFSGRSFTLGPGKNTCNQEGVVILDVILKPDGSIVYEGINPGSSASSCLEQVAIKYLRSSHFNPSANPVSVEGTITFVFKLK